MNKKCFQTVLVFLMVIFTAAYAVAHCEIPCGIYDDEMRARVQSTQGKIAVTFLQVILDWLLR